MGIPTLNFIISATNKFAPAFDELAAAMTRGAYQGTLMANAVGFALGKVGDGAAFVNSKLAEATELQLTNISTASTFASLTGASFDQSADVIEKLNARLAKSAAALPGVTQQYKDLAMGISANLVEAFKNPDGKLRVKDWENSLSSITESYTALTAASTRDVGNTRMILTKALAGQASMTELSNMSFFEKNINVMNELRRLMKDKGKTELKQLSLAERADILDKAAKKFITDDFKKRAGNSVDGLIQSYNTTLFDPTEGVFGIMRKFGEGKNATSAFNEYNKLLISVIGENGLAGNIGKLVGTLMGWDADTPMRALAGVFSTFNNLVVKINSFVADINKSLEGVKDPGQAWGIVFGKVNRLLTANKFDVADSIGSVIASFSKWVSGAIKGITDSNIVGNLLSILPGLVDTFIQILPDFIVGIITIVPDIINFISSSILSAGGVFAQIGLKLVTGLLTINWGKILYSIFDAISRINWVNLIGAFVTVAAIAPILGTITGIFGAIASIFSLSGFTLIPVLMIGFNSLLGLISGAIINTLYLPVVGLLSSVVPMIATGVILPVSLFIAGLGLAAIAMGYSVDDIKLAASEWAKTAEKATGIKVDGLGSAIAATIMGYWQGFKDIGNGVLSYFSAMSVNISSDLSTIRSVTNSYWSAIVSYWTLAQAESYYYVAASGKSISTFWEILTTYWSNAQVYLLGWTTEVNYLFVSWGKTFKDGWENASKVVSDVLLGIKQTWEDFKSSVNSLTTPLKTAIDSFFKAIDDFFKSIKLPSISMPSFSAPAAVAPAVTTATNVVSNVVNAASSAMTAGTNAASGVVGAITDAAKNLTGGATPAATTTTTTPATTTTPPVVAKWQGNIPAASNGLFEAIKTESANMPTGAGLAIANTSEFILTPEQMRNFVSNSSGGGVSNSFVFGDIVINGAENVKEIAGAVMREISAQLEEYTNGQLA